GETVERRTSGDGAFVGKVTLDLVAPGPSEGEGVIVLDPGVILRRSHGPGGEEATVVAFDVLAEVGADAGDVGPADFAVGIGQSHAGGPIFLRGRRTVDGFADDPGFIE